MLRIEQADDRREHLVAIELAVLEVAFDAFANLWECLPEFPAAVIFVRIFLCAIIGMIAILLAPARVLAGGLDMAVGMLAEPGVDIGGWERERIESLDLLTVGDSRIAVVVSPAVTGLLAGVAWLSVR